MTKIALVLAYVIGGGVLGGLLSGFDRILTARMQSRKGPPLLQPFFDVLKLMDKRTVVVNNYQHFNVACFLIFIVLTGSLFFVGGDLLLTIFALTVAGFFWCSALILHIPPTARSARSGNCSR